MPRFRRWLYLTTQPDGSSDVITCFDAVEHFTKERGHLLIREMKRVARKHVMDLITYHLTEGHMACNGGPSVVKLAKTLVVA